MLSNREIKWINSLKNKKYRLKHRAYVAEGPRLVDELIQSGQTAIKIVQTDDAQLESNISQQVVSIVSESELKQVSEMVQPNGVLAVFEMPSHDASNLLNPHPAGKWGFAFDFIQDPGNLGTIIRTLSWFGIEHLYCSRDSVDVFNPKVVQASMGAVGNLQPKYVDLSSYLREQGVKIYAADMEGTPLGKEIPEPGILVFGNEGKGLSDAVREVCQSTLSIPRAGAGESLNVAVSTAIFAAWFSLQ